MNRPDAVHAQAYYGTPVGGMRLSPVAGARPQAGGVPYEEPVVQPEVPIKASKRKQAKTEAV